MCLKWRADRDGKEAVIRDGVLHIDDIATFSLKEGFITQYVVAGSSNNRS